MNILLTIAYDGTNYAGWQSQKNAVTIQQRLEEGLLALLGKNIKVTGASRTDAGVHALGQRASFVMDNMPIPLKKLPYAINSHLPQDIRIQAAQIVPDDFNPRFNAKAKTYRYQIYNAEIPNPMVSRYSAFVPQKLEVEAMVTTCNRLVGRHDFAAFCASGSSVKTTVRTIFACDVVQENELVSINIIGDGFLYNMVRIIAGTAVYSGVGKISANDIPEIIASCDRSKAGKTMPPQGLTLVEVMYDEKL